MKKNILFITMTLFVFNYQQANSVYNIPQYIGFSMIFAANIAVAPKVKEIIKKNSKISKLQNIETSLITMHHEITENNAYPADLQTIINQIILNTQFDFNWAITIQEIYGKTQNNSQAIVFGESKQFEELLFSETNEKSALFNTRKNLNTERSERNVLLNPIIITLGIDLTIAFLYKDKIAQFFKKLSS